MPDAAREWLQKYEEWVNQSGSGAELAAPAEHLRRLLAECERLERELDTEGSMRWEAQSDYGNLMDKTEQLEAGRKALVAYVRDYASHKAWCCHCDCGFVDATQALGAELQEAIDES